MPKNPVVGSRKRTQGTKIKPRRLRRLLIVLLTTLAIFLLLIARLRPEQVRWQVGDLATRTIKATRATTYVDPQATQELRNEAAMAVPPQYVRDADAPTRAVQTVHDIFAQARFARQLPASADRLTALRNRLDIQLSEESLRTLLEASDGALERMEQLTAAEVRTAMERPIHSNTEELAEARAALARRAAQLSLTPRYQRLLAEIGAAALQPNWLYDAEATATKRAEAAQNVPEVRRQLQPGDIVIMQGERVTERHLAMFQALGLTQPTVDYLQGLSLLGVLLALMAATAFFWRRFASDFWSDERQLLLSVATLVVVAGLFGLFRGAAWFEAFGISAVSAASIFLALATKPLVASGAAIFLGALVSLASPISEAHLLLTAILAALFASDFVRPRESRSNTVARAAVFTAIANTSLTLLNAYVFGFFVRPQELGLVAGGGFLAAIVAAGLLSLLERPLGLTTPLRLLELQNPNEPLLRRLLQEAPGTYQSSVMVANLAEPAAAAIGADPILTRTACLYHDIGKLKRPYFFIENQFGRENPHDRLSPHLSVLVIISHVKEGVEMARTYRLPEPIISAIAEHHGTSLVSFMYQRAQAEAPAGVIVRQSDYRYPGPKPQTRENAIIMLADAVEAAARAENEPTRQRLETIVEQIVEARIADGQLSEAPLTFRDITVIKQVFVHTLVGMFHQRLVYPSEPLREIEKEVPPTEQTKVAHGD